MNVVLAEGYLDRFRSGLAAYNAIQARLMQRFLDRGGTVELWMSRLAPVFRQRYGWLCEPVPIRIEEVRRDGRRRR